MRPLLPLGVKRRISVESPSPFLNAVERQACTISFPGTVCRTLPEGDPREPALCPCMILRLESLRIVHASQRHIDRIGQIEASIRQRSTTPVAESTKDVAGRSMGSGLAPCKGEFVRVKSGPRHEGR